MRYKKNNSFLLPTLLCFIFSCQNQINQVKTKQMVSFDSHDFSFSLENLLYNDWNYFADKDPLCYRIDYDWNADGSIDLAEGFTYNNKNQKIQEWHDIQSDGIIEYQTDRDIGVNYLRTYTINKMNIHFEQRIFDQCNSDIQIFNRSQIFENLIYYKNHRVTECTKNNDLIVYESDSVEWKDNDAELYLDNIPEYSKKIANFFNENGNIIGARSKKGG